MAGYGTLSRTMLRKIEDGVHGELISLSRVTSTDAALNQVFESLVRKGVLSKDMRYQFLIFAAPMIRRMRVVRINDDMIAGPGFFSQSNAVDWYDSLEANDPIYALMVDLHYFARLSIHETAEALEVTPEEVEAGIGIAKERLYQYTRGVTRTNAGR